MEFRLLKYPKTMVSFEEAKTNHSKLINKFLIENNQKNNFIIENLKKFLQKYPECSNDLFSLIQYENFMRNYFNLLSHVALKMNFLLARDYLENLERMNASFKYYRYLLSPKLNYDFKKFENYIDKKDIKKIKNIISNIGEDLVMKEYLDSIFNSFDCLLWNIRMDMQNINGNKEEYEIFGNGSKIDMFIKKVASDKMETSDYIKNFNILKRNFNTEHPRSKLLTSYIFNEKDEEKRKVVSLPQLQMKKTENIVAKTLLKNQPLKILNNINKEGSKKYTTFQEILNNERYNDKESFNSYID